MSSKYENIKTTDIAIIGLAGRFPGADNVDDFWINQQQGIESITTLTKDKLIECGIDNSILSNLNYVNSCGYIENIDEFDNNFFGISPYEAAILDPQHRLFLEVAYHALESSGYDSNKYKGRIGIYAGAGTTNYYYELIKRGYVESVSQSEQLMICLGNEKEFIPLRAAYKLNLTGAAVNINLGSATGLAVIVKACQALVQMEADIMLAGAVYLVLPNRFGYIYEPGNIFAKDGHCKAFDENSAGTVLGSGVGVLVLKRLVDAIQDRDNIHAVIIGYAINNDGHNKIGFTAPSVDGQSACVQEALNIAKINPEKIRYVEAHGTGTRLGDPIEVAALTQAYRKCTDKKQYCAIGSVKSNIGHAQAAAGIAGIIKLIMMIKHKKIPPTCNFSGTNPEIKFSDSPFYVNTELTNWNEDVCIGAVNSIAMGGVNVHVILKNYAKISINKYCKNNFNHYNVLVLSARNKRDLEKLRLNLLQYMRSILKGQKCDKYLFHSIAYTLQVGRKDLAYRKAWVCHDIQDAIAKLQKPEGDLGLVIENKFKRLLTNWLIGNQVCWDDIYIEKPGRVSLPVYPFIKEKFWFTDLFATSYKQLETLEEHNAKISSNKNSIDSIIYELKNLWQRSLKINFVNIYDDFELIGGDSLLAIDIINVIEKKFNVRLDVESLFKYKRLVDLAQYILELTNGMHGEYLSVVKLSKFNRKGSPVFIIHPGNGELYNYKLLGKNMHENFVPYGIKNSPFNDLREKTISIYKFAKRYVELIKKVQRRGPYILCGWSFGGVVAFEMARQLLEQKAIVSHVFLIDSWAKCSDKLCDKNYFFNCYLKANNNQRKLLKDSGLWGRLMWNRIQALMAYHPVKLNIPITLFKAEDINDEYEDVNVIDNHWQYICHRRVSVLLIPGNHITILQEPSLYKLIKLFNMKLNEIKK